MRTNASPTTASHAAPRVRLGAFHSAARQTLMRTEEGRKAYGEAQGSRRPSEWVNLFIDVVHRALGNLRHSEMALHLHCSHADNLAIQWHTQVLGPAVVTWRECLTEIQAAAELSIGQDATKVVRDAASELRSATSSATLGRLSDASKGRRNAVYWLDAAAHEVGEQHPSTGEMLRKLSQRVEAAWPTDVLLRGEPESPEYQTYLDRDERSRDLEAVARWMAPDVGRVCVTSGVEPTPVLEVGNVLSSGGGGLDHLRKVWPETKARIDAIVLSLELRDSASPGEDQVTPSAPDPDLVVLGYDPTAKSILANGAVLRYGPPTGGRGGKITTRHRAFRLLYALARGKAPLHAGSDSVGDLNSALRAGRAGCLQLVHRDGEYVIQGQVSFEKNLLDELGEAVKRRH